MHALRLQSPDHREMVVLSELLLKAQNFCGTGQWVTSHCLTTMLMTLSGREITKGRDMNRLRPSPAALVKAVHSSGSIEQSRFSSAAEHKG